MTAEPMWMSWGTASTSTAAVSEVRAGQPRRRAVAHESTGRAATKATSTRRRSPTVRSNDHGQVGNAASAAFNTAAAAP